MGDLVGIASDVDVVQKSGSWYSFGEVRLGQGKEKAVEFLQADPELMNTIRNQVMDVLKLDAKRRKAPNTDLGSPDSEDEALEA